MDDTNQGVSIVIVVIGESGVGKSTFVQLATGDESIVVGNETQKISAHYVQVDNDQALLLDTPGFDHTSKSDIEVLREISLFLSKIYTTGLTLTAILYLYPICNLRITESARRRLRMVQKMVGDDALPYLTLVSTKWDWVDDEVRGWHRERCFRTLFEIKREGGVVPGCLGARLDRMTRENALDIIRLNMNRPPVAFKIQKELVDRGLPLIETEAVKELFPSFSDGGDNAESSTNIESESSIYEPLGPGEIRLVNLLCGESSQPVTVQLLIMPFWEKLKFEALSYSVGRSEKIAALNLRRYGQVERLPVTARLESILRNLRHPNRDRRLWIDAISINQTDLGERAREVRRMGDIFARAQNVCIWLGDSADESDLAMDFITEVLDIDAFDRLVRDNTKTRHWLALAKLMAREWFTRRWVVQEMALARRATVHCGSRIVSWWDMAVAAGLFGTRWADIVRQLPPMEAFKFGDVQTPGATSLVELSAKVLRRTGQFGTTLQRRLSLEELLAILPMFDVTEPSDAVYSIINIAYDTHQTEAISVDYNLKPEVVFSEVVDLIIKTSGSMDIICRPWAPDCINLPSFISTISDYAFERRPDGQYYRQNADCLTGFPGRRIYQAAARFSPQYEMLSLGSQRFLVCDAIILGHVLSTGGRSVNGNVPREWTNLAGWPDRSKPMPENFWRTLVGDRGPDGTDPPNWYANICNYAFSRARRDIDITEMLKISMSSNERHFLHRVQATIWNRTFFTMKNVVDLTVSFGLGPPDMISGDRIAIIYGCSVPVLVRETHPIFPSRGLSTHKLLGGSFVHGYMDGEAFRTVGLGQFELRRLQLV